MVNLLRIIFIRFTLSTENSIDICTVHRKTYNMPIITRPNEKEYSTFYQTYTSKVEGEDAFAALEKAALETVLFFEKIPEEKWNYRYAPGKWSLKESIIHMIDAERVFAYRAMRIARNDQTPLMGFDQDPYIQYYHAVQRSPESIISEYRAVRSASLELFRNLSSEDLLRKGTASDSPVSVRALAYIIAGHEEHHIRLTKEKYLI